MDQSQEVYDRNCPKERILGNGLDFQCGASWKRLKTTDLASPCVPLGQCFSTFFKSRNLDTKISANLRILTEPCEELAEPRLKNTALGSYWDNIDRIWSAQLKTTEKSIWMEKNVKNRWKILHVWNLKCAMKRANDCHLLNLCEGIQINWNSK